MNSYQEFGFLPVCESDQASMVLSPLEWLNHLRMLFFSLKIEKGSQGQEMVKEHNDPSEGPTFIDGKQSLLSNISPIDVGVHPWRKPFFFHLIYLWVAKGTGQIERHAKL